LATVNISEFNLEVPFQVVMDNYLKCDILIGREILQLGFGVMIDASKYTMYKGGQKYFHKTKVKYTHNLNLHLLGNLNAV